VSTAEDRMIAAQRDITLFRNKELMIDPQQNSTSIAEIVGQLSSELVVAKAGLAEIKQSAPDSTSVPYLSSRIQALEAQIDLERSRMAGTPDSIAPRIADYEGLILQREFADKALLSALDALKTARADARRQQLYLEVVVNPNLPDQALLPLGLKNTFVTMLCACMAYLLGWLLITSIRDHAN
jgi:capsular polysaccharide transport system permease protein